MAGAAQKLLHFFFRVRLLCLDDGDVLFELLDGLDARDDRVGVLRQREAQAFGNRGNLDRKSVV